MLLVPAVPPVPLGIAPLLDAVPPVDGAGAGAGVAARNGILQSQRRMAQPPPAKAAQGMPSLPFRTQRQ